MNKSHPLSKKKLQQFYGKPTRELSVAVRKETYQKLKKLNRDIQKLNKEKEIEEKYLRIFVK